MRDVASRQRGYDLLERWLKRWEETSERGVFSENQKHDDTQRREMMRFPQEPRKNRELRWTADAVFRAFGVEMEGDNVWNPATKVQVYGGLLLARNGWRNMTSHDAGA